MGDADDGDAAWAAIQADLDAAAVKFAEARAGLERAQALVDELLPAAAIDEFIRVDVDDRNYVTGIRFGAATFTAPADRLAALIPIYILRKVGRPAALTAPGVLEAAGSASVAPVEMSSIDHSIEVTAAFGGIEALRVDARRVVPEELDALGDELAGLIRAAQEKSLPIRTGGR